MQNMEVGATPASPDVQAVPADEPAATQPSPEEAAARAESLQALIGREEQAIVAARAALGLPPAVGDTPAVAVARAELSAAESLVRGAERVTQSAAFKEWFGDWQGDPANASKIVDAEGKPRRVFHGGADVIDEFDPTRSDPLPGRVQGNYFSSSADISGGYAERKGGGVMPVFLNVRNPLVTNPNDPFPYFEDAVRFAAERGSHSVTAADLTRAAKERGHDGVIYEYPYRGDLVWEVVTFAPEQVKSAIGNGGTFSAASRSIVG